MFRIVICDDEKNMRDQLRSYLEKLQIEMAEQFDILEFSSGQELLERYPTGVDIVLLDIQMESQDGLSTAQRIREFAPDVCLIFITNMANYALKSYQVRAFSFLPKPLTYNQFRREIFAAIQLQKRRNAHYIFVVDAETRALHQLDSRDIIYLEARNHQITAVLQDRAIKCRKPLSEFEEELKQFGFFRCHSAFLVNHRAITRIEQNNIIIARDVVLPISKTRRRVFLSELMEYVGEML